MASPIPDRHVDGLEQKYGNFDVRSLGGPAVPAADNRARVVRAAAALVATPNDTRVAVTPFVALRGPDPVPADLRSYVAANRSALRVAEEARGRSLSHWEADYSNSNAGPPWTEIRTLSDYQLVHALALVLVGVLIGRRPARLATVVGWCFTLGIVLFSGSLYVLTLTGTTAVGIVTPLGGLCQYIHGGPERRARQSSRAAITARRNQ